MKRAMTAQWESEFHWTRLIDLEGETNFTLQNRFFSLHSAFRLSRVGSDYACSRFARSTVPEEIWRLLVVYVFCPSQKQINERALIPLVRCQVGPKCLSISLIIDLSIFIFFFSREQNFPINVAILEATEWCQRYLSLKFHIMASWQCGFKIKLSRLESFIIV